MFEDAPHVHGQRKKIQIQRSKKSGSSSRNDLWSPRHSDHLGHVLSSCATREHTQRLSV